MSQIQNSFCREIPLALFGNCSTTPNGTGRPSSCKAKADAVIQSSGKTYRSPFVSQLLRQPEREVSVSESQKRSASEHTHIPKCKGSEFSLKVTSCESEPRLLLIHLFGSCLSLILGACITLAAGSE